MNSSSSPIDTVIEDAIRRHRAGQLNEAQQLYLQVLADDPAHPEANHNLGVILTQRGESEAGISYFRAALQHEPGKAMFWLSYARALILAGQNAAAIAALEQGSQYGLSGPGYDALMAQAKAATSKTVARDRELFNLGNILTEQGKFAEAIAAYREALAINPDFADVHYHLGSVLSENGRIAEGFDHFMRRAALVCGATKGLPKTKPDPLHKIKHDQEQRDYLTAANVCPPATDVDDIFHVGDGGRVQGAAINPANATPELLQAWRTSQPQTVVIENFLMPEALTKLRVYCAESTIWRRIYDAGYIGATPADGFACPLLAQIAEEIQILYPDIFSPHTFRYLGAFKYDSALSMGTNTHADYSAVNVNFYIAPDDANLDPESGGMLIWDREAKDEAEMRRYNSDEKAARMFLEKSGAKVIRIPHRANRAVVFKSSLFHKTDDCRFIEGYLNKRINVSLLFGQFGAATRS